MFTAGTMTASHLHDPYKRAQPPARPGMKSARRTTRATGSASRLHCQPVQNPKQANASPPPPCSAPGWRTPNQNQDKKPPYLNKNMHIYRPCELACLGLAPRLASAAALLCNRGGLHLGGIWVERSRALDMTWRDPRAQPGAMPMGLLSLAGHTQEAHARIRFYLIYC